MDIFTILFLIGAALILPLMIYVATSRAQVGSPLIAGLLSLGFGLFTLFTIMREGLEQVIFNHNINFWGTQVWYDLVMAVTVALFFIVPRARAAGMSIIPWVVFVALTASVGLLAMVARLFWLERQSQQA